jgi:hypothetical protein
MSISGRRFRTALGQRPIATAFGAAALLLVAAAPGQAQPTSKTQTQSQTAAPAISDQKIDAAAKAMAQVSSVRQSYEQKIAGASDADKGKLMNEAGHAMTKAVTDRGLSVAEYNAIVDRAKSDPEIRHKLVAHLPPDTNR